MYVQQRRHRRHHSGDDWIADAEWHKNSNDGVKLRFHSFIFPTTSIKCLRVLRNPKTTLQAWYWRRLDSRCRMTQKRQRRCRTSIPFFYISYDINKNVSEYFVLPKTTLQAWYWRRVDSRCRMPQPQQLRFCTWIPITWTFPYDMDKCFTSNKNKIIGGIIIIIETSE